MAAPVLVIEVDNRTVTPPSCHVERIEVPSRGVQESRLVTPDLALVALVGLGSGLYSTLKAVGDQR
jgi:hypothetical protein